MVWNNTRLQSRNGGEEGQVLVGFGDRRWLGSVLRLAAIVITYIFAGVGTFPILKVVDAVVGLRIKEENEFQGMHINEHGEEGYGEEFGGGMSGSKAH